MKLILATLDQGMAVAVILNGILVYHEDDDKGATNQCFSAREVATRLSSILRIRLVEVDLDWNDVSQEDWNFVDVMTAAIAKA